MHQRVLLALAGTSLGALALGVITLGAVSLGHANLSALAFAGLLLLFLVGGLAGFAAWVVGLMRAARFHRWGWLVAVLALGPLGALFYTLAGPDAAGARQEPAM